MTDEKDLCFVIMPFGKWFDHYYKQIYKTAILNAGLTPRRADEIFTASTVIDDIWALTKKAKIILADLTGKNPNVFYELGLAHALSKPALLISESMDDVPFDLRHLRVITYDKNDLEWGKKLGNDITKAIRKTLAAPEKSVLPTFLKSGDVTDTVTDNPENAELRNLKYEVNYIKNTLNQLVNSQNTRKFISTPMKGKKEKRPPDDEIENLIRSGIKKGAADSRIIGHLNSLNVPIAEAEKRLSIIKAEKENG